VTLDHPASYIGFQWEAGDGGNVLTLYSGASAVATFTTQDLLAMLYKNAMGDWSAEDYLINPGTNKRTGDPYAYIYLNGINGLTFDSFAVSHPLNKWAFEFDNFSLSDTPVTLDPATVTIIGDETPPDANGNGIDDTTEDVNGDEVIDPFEDTDGDGVGDVFEDTDGDGISDYAERVTLADTGIDLWAVTSTSGLLLGTGFLLILLRRRLQRAEHSD
jgi:hypothetical protein